MSSHAGPYNSDGTLALFNLGFRPFFLGAGVFAVLSVALWMAVYVYRIEWTTDGLTSFQWHAHEMIYGYSLAVIAGFLLTAVKNWTGLQTVHGRPLACLFLSWVMARLLSLPGTDLIRFAGIFDIVFALMLCLATMYPIVQARNWRQLGILSKMLLLAAGNLCFYMGLSGFLEQGIYWSLYGGLYLVISLVLTVGNRVLPFFIERGVGYRVELYHAGWLTGASLLLFAVFFVAEIFLQNAALSSLAASGLFITTTLRLIGWHTPGIWKKPLIWCLYLSFGFIALGFLLFALSGFTGVTKLIAVHLLAYGGIGLMTLGMMARVALGHTGRDIHRPPKAVIVAFYVLICGAVVRTGLPLLDPRHYVAWIALSQVLWITAFLLFLSSYRSILIQPRIDGQFG